MVEGTANSIRRGLDIAALYIGECYDAGPDPFSFFSFVRPCQTPVLVRLDDTPAHPLDVAVETAMLAPKSEVGLYPWKEPKERIPLAVRQVRSFLRAHRPVTA